uniref:Death-associated inhibitor of apoptosis 2-like n=1 Tax=Crassostrea virginica TaxID=6565 RepID=A0A8B8ADR3_CRAVI|nr:death-associated inhibitor of apoptosis 2-like [Crassostrea virginica]
MSSTKKQMWVLVLFESEEVLSHPLPLGEVQDSSGRNGEEADLQEREHCMAQYYVGDEMREAIIFKRSESQKELKKIYEELLEAGKKEQKEKERKSFWRRAKVLGVGLLVGGAAVVGAPLALSAMGFSSTIVAGSLAAKMMSMAAIANGGGVAAGGLIATAQSAGAAGIATSTSVLIGTTAGSAGAFIAKKMFKEESQDSSKRKPSSKSDGSDFDKDAPSPRTSDSSDQDLEDVGSPQNTSSVPLSESPEAARSAASSHPGNPVTPVGEEEEGVTAQVGNLSLNARAETAEHLLLENQRLQEEKLCKICMDAEMDILFLPCGHLCTCRTCAIKLRECPVCKERIQNQQRVYKS